MNSMCPESGRVIAVKKLQYGMKSDINDECPENIEAAENGHNTTCCQFQEGDCLKSITDYRDKYMYLSRLSRLPAISQNTATPRQYMRCTNNSRTYSNYVQVVFDCVDGKIALLILYVVQRISRTESKEWNTCTLFDSCLYILSNLNLRTIRVFSEISCFVFGFWVLGDFFIFFFWGGGGRVTFFLQTTASISTLLS